jgi:YVTN family beta-propeller protein
MSSARPRAVAGVSARRGRLVSVLSAALVLVLACGDNGTGPDPDDVVDLSVTAPSSTLDAIDGTVQLDVEALDADGNPVTGLSYTWTSSDADVVTVDDDGLVTAVDNGSASVRAAVGSVSGAISITVEQVVTDLVFSGAPGNTSVDVAFDGLAVAAHDANGHVATNFTDAVAISIGTNPQGGSLSGQFSRNAVDGVAAFPGLALTAPGAAYTLEATADGFSVESDPFNVTLPSAYVGHFGGSVVTVLDLTTNSVLTTVTVGSQPTGIGLTPDGLFAYASNRASGTVSVIETPGNTVVETIAGTGTNGQLLGVSPDGSLVYVGNSAVDSVTVIETATNTVTGAIAVGDFPLAVAFTPDGAFAYVANSTSDDVSVIETATGTVVGTITVGNDPIGLVTTPDGSFVYVTNSTAGTVSVIATSTNTVVGTIPVGSVPQLPGVTPDGSAIFVPNSAGSTVSRIATSSNTVTATIAVGTSPIAVAVTPDGAFAYVTHNSTSPVAVIDIATNTVVDMITLSAGAAALAIMPAPIP